MSETLVKRRRLTIVAIEERPLAGQLVTRSPFVVKTQGFDLKGFSPPTGVGKKQYARIVEEERPCLVLVSNDGARHHFWRRDDRESPQVWYFTKTPQGFLRSSPDGIEVTSFSPGGVFLTDRILYEQAITMKVGDEFGWEFPFQEVTRPIRGRTFRVLACGGARSYFLPLELLERSRAARDPWPDYVKRLSAAYPTPAAWRGLIRSLEGKYFHGLFARDQPIVRAIKALTRAGTSTESAGGKRSPPYCFDGMLPDMKLAEDDQLHVVPRIAWGDQGDLAWIYQLKGKTVLVLVDKPRSQRAAWVFPDEESAAQLLSELPQGVDWRERLEGLKDRAIYYCPHQGAWQDRLVLLILKVLGQSGCEGAETAFASFSSTRAEVAKQVAGILESHRKRRSV